MPRTRPAPPRRLLTGLPPTPDRLRAWRAAGVTGLIVAGVQEGTELHAAAGTGLELWLGYFGQPLPAWEDDAGWVAYYRRAQGLAKRGAEAGATALLMDTELYVGSWTGARPPNHGWPAHPQAASRGAQYAAAVRATGLRLGWYGTWANEGREPGFGSFWGAAGEHLALPEDLYVNGYPPVLRLCRTIQAALPRATVLPGVAWGTTPPRRECWFYQES